MKINILDNIMTMLELQALTNLVETCKILKL